MAALLSHTCGCWSITCSTRVIRGILYICKRRFHVYFVAQNQNTKCGFAQDTDERVCVCFVRVNPNQGRGNEESQKGRHIVQFPSGRDKSLFLNTVLRDLQMIWIESTSGQGFAMIAFA